MTSRLAGMSLLAAFAASASAFHEGDMIFGAVGGQIVVVDPTDVLASPPSFDFRYRAASSTAPAFLEQNVGWDKWDLPSSTITEVREATLTPTYISPGLQFRDSLYSYFSPNATRQTFRLQGVSRHKHFSVFSFDTLRPRTYTFRWKLTNAIDINGNTLADSPEYTMRFQRVGDLLSASPTPVVADGFDSYGMGGADVVPEPATLTALGLGLLLLRRRKR